MKYFTTLIVFALLFVTTAKAQLANSNPSVSKGLAVVASSYLLSGNDFIVELTNTSNFKLHGFAVVKDESVFETTVFVCKVTKSHLVLRPPNLSANFPLKLSPGEIVTVYPVHDPDNIMGKRLAGYNELCESCKMTMHPDNSGLDQVN